MKNKNLILAVIIVILTLLFGVGGYFVLNKNASNTTNKSAGETQTNNTQPEQTSKSLLDLVKMGQNLRCSFKTDLSNGSTDGTVYISGQNLRGDFTINVSGEKPAQTSMIKKGDTTYIWGSTMPDKGIKMTVSLDEVSENKQASQYVDPNQKINYNCSAWSVDSTLFNPPSNIKFTDMSNFILPQTDVTGTPTSTTTKTSSDPCASITDPTTKTACENALKQSSQ